jgi:hypothetical protein
MPAAYPAEHRKSVRQCQILVSDEPYFVGVVIFLFPDLFARYVLMDSTSPMIKTIMNSDMPT